MFSVVRVGQSPAAGALCGRVALHACRRLARRDLEEMKKGSMDPFGEQRTSCARLRCIVAIVLTGVYALVLLASLDTVLK